MASLLFAAGWSLPAAAEIEPQQAGGPSLEPTSGQLGPAATPASGGGERGDYALLLHIGPYSGFGAGVSAGTPAVGVRASVGWTPLLLFLQQGSELADVRFYSSFQISPDVYVRLFHPRPTTHLGLQAGYRYSSLLGHGFAFGGYAQFALSRAFDGFVSGGVFVFPDGEDHLRSEDRTLPANSSFSTFPGPKVNFGLSLGVALFP